jgi:hypothetical protein
VSAHTPLTLADLERIVRAAESSWKEDGGASPALWHLAAAVSDEVANRRVVAERSPRYKPVTNEAGQPLFVHVCGWPRFGSAITGLVRSGKCGHCFGSTNPNTWRLAYVSGTEGE